MRVEEVAVPRQAAELNLFDRVDYQDAFSVAAVHPRTPEALMRDVMEGAPAWFLFSWSNVLGKAILGGGLDRRPDAKTVVGWKVLVDTGDVFVVGLDTPRGLDARLFTLTSPDQEIIGTQIRLNTSYVRRWWPAIHTGHRFFLPYLLKRSARRAELASR